MVEIMESTKRIYPSQQLVCCLDPRVLKVFLWLCGWQSQGEIKLYVSQMAKYLHLTEEEVARCIQTLVDIKLLEVIKVERQWIAKLNAAQVDKYFKIPIAKIVEGKGIPMAESATWNQVEAPRKDTARMSDAELRLMIQSLQAQLAERAQTKQRVASVVSNDVDLSELSF